MNAKNLVFVICVEAIIYLSLNNLHDCTFKVKQKPFLIIFKGLSMKQIKSKF